MAGESFAGHLQASPALPSQNKAGYIGEAALSPV